MKPSSTALRICICLFPLWPTLIQSANADIPMTAQKQEDTFALDREQMKVRVPLEFRVNKVSAGKERIYLKAYLCRDDVAPGSKAKQGESDDACRFWFKTPTVGTGGTTAIRTQLGKNNSAWKSFDYILLKTFRFKKFLFWEEEPIIQTRLVDPDAFLNRVLFSGTGRKVRAMNKSRNISLEISSRFLAEPGSHDPQSSIENTASKLPPQYSNILSMDSGVRENYTLKEHDLRVLANFNRFGGCHLPKTDKPEMDAAFMRDLLILHDIGKPKASLDGHHEDQHVYTLPLMIDAMKILGYKQDRIRLATALLDNDFLGELGQDLLTVNEAFLQLIDLSKKAGLPPKVFYAYQKTYFVSDAASYPYLAGLVFELRKRSDQISACLDMRAQKYRELEAKINSL